MDRQRALDLAIRNGDPLPEPLSSFRAEYRSVFEAARRSAEKKIGASLSSKARSQTTCWNLLRKLRNPSRAVAIDADSLFNHFRSVFYDPDEPLFFDLASLGIVPPQNFTPTMFTDQELVQALKALNSQAAVGPQRVASRYIKHVFQSEKARIPLLYLLNRCYHDGTVPAKWGISEVFVLYKGKGLITDPVNYRGINLNDDFLRLYERLLNQRMMSWLHVERPWGIQQFGFSHGVGTEDAFVCLESLAGYCTRISKLPLYANFIDLQRAFPSMLRTKALAVLNEMGLPYELLRAFASTFSGNSCRLRINDKLTRSFFVNRGTKEGGINSPSIFNTVYAFLLRKLGVTDYPKCGEDFDPEKVYYLVFADDLVITGANITKLELVMVELDHILADVGMKVNAGKTKWLAYLPQEPAPSFVPFRGFHYGSCFLENVDRFKYLGFETSWDLSHRHHIQSRTNLLFLAAKMSGKLLRSLEVTNFRSLRAYFYSLVCSQLYSFGVITFDSAVFERAQKLFLQEVFNLPDSFAYYMAKFLLGVEDFLLLSFDARVKFLQRIVNGNSEASLSAMILDREFLFPVNVGWNAGFHSLFPDRIEFTDYDLSDSGDTVEVRQRIFQFVMARDIDRLRGSAAAFLIEIFPTPTLPTPLATHLGTLPLESVRIIVLFLANMVQRTYLKSLDLKCPFCPGELSSEHLFTCPGSQSSLLCNWSRFMAELREHLYQDAIDRLFLVLQRWHTVTNHFTPGFGAHLDEYFEYTTFGSRRRGSDWLSASLIPLHRGSI